MRTFASPDTEYILRDLEHAVLRLADAVDGEPQIAAALRRFAGALPEVPDGPPRADDVRGVLYSALAEGELDARGFDWLMVAERRARRSQ
jgi:hypothetical protein